jgi:hypothetical protein
MDWSLDIGQEISPNGFLISWPAEIDPKLTKSSSPGMVAFP